MQERVKELLKKVIYCCKRLKIKQRTMIVCIRAGIILALVVVLSVLSRPKFTLLK